MENVWENWTTITGKLLSDSIDFTPEEITYLLSEMGLIGAEKNCIIEDLEKCVFLQGNQEEIYGYEERSFIESVGSVYIYNNINRITNKGTIATKIFAADLCQFDDAVRSSFFLMKIINKAEDSFNIFLLKTGDGFFLGCRLYDKDLARNCTLTEAIKSKSEYEILIERLLYLPNTNEFVPYYSSLVECIETYDRVNVDYDLKISLRRGINFNYLEALSDIESFYHLNLAYAKEMYYKTFEAGSEMRLTDEYKEILDSLSFVKSQQMNSLEMLFDAEELMLMAVKVEQETEEMLNKENRKTEEADTEELMKYISDPEKIIRFLKEKKER